MACLASSGSSSSSSSSSEPAPDPDPDPDAERGERGKEVEGAELAGLFDGFASSFCRFLADSVELDGGRDRLKDLVVEDMSSKSTVMVVAGQAAKERRRIRGRAGRDG